MFDIYLTNNKFNRARLMQSQFNDLWQNTDTNLAASLHNWYLMGSAHLLRIEGSYKEAIGKFEEELALYGKTMSIGIKTHILSYIGYNHLLNSNFQASFINLNQAIKFSRKTNDVGIEAWILFYFIVLSLEMKDSDRAGQFFERMKIIYNTIESNHFSETVYNLSEASMLKNSGRLRDKMMAQQIFEQVVNHKIPTFPDFYEYAVLNHIELLFLEFRSSKDLKILKLIKRELLLLEKYFEETQSIATKVYQVIFISRYYFLSYVSKRLYRN